MTATDLATDNEEPPLQVVWRVTLRVLPYFVIVATVLVGLFAPLIANDVPLMAEVDGKWAFPALTCWAKPRRVPTI